MSVQGAVTPYAQQHSSLSDSGMCDVDRCCAEVSRGGGVSVIRWRTTALARRELRACYRWLRSNSARTLVAERAALHDARQLRLLSERMQRYPIGGVEGTSPPMIGNGPGPREQWMVKDDSWIDAVQQCLNSG